MIVLPDRTGCVHTVVNVSEYGVNQCSKCDRLFDVVCLANPRLQVRATLDPPEHGFYTQYAIGSPQYVSNAKTSDASVTNYHMHETKLDQIRALIPGLESERATRGVAERLKVILGGME